MTTRIPNYLKNLLATGEGSDFSIFVLDEEGNRIERKVHKIVIRQCPYFAAMLDLKGTEANSGSATIENITSGIFNYVLDYIYADALEIMTMEQALKVAVAADYLQLDDLQKKSLKLWRDYFITIKSPKDIVEAIITLIASSLHIKLDENWRKVLESLVLVMYDSDANFNIVEEEASFVEFLIDYYGLTYPCLSTHTLVKWTLAEGLELTDEQRSERKKQAEAMLDKVYLSGMTLQTLAMISKTQAFPALYMLEQIQQRATERDLPASDKVDYTITIKVSQIVELEFEASYVLFRFMDLDEEITYNEPIALWEFLYVPVHCKAKVALIDPAGSDAGWPAFTGRGILAPPMRLKDYKNKSGDYVFKVTLTHLGDRTAVRYEYELNFDEDFGDLKLTK